MVEQGLGEITKSENLLRAKERKLWTAMIANFLKAHDTNKKNKSNNNNKSTKRVKFYGKKFGTKKVS